AASGPRRWFYIEIKTDPTEPALSAEAEPFTRKVVEAIEAHDYVDRAKIIAFDWRGLRFAAAPKPAVAPPPPPHPAAAPPRQAPGGRGPRAPPIAPRRGSTAATHAATAARTWPRSRRTAAPSGRPTGRTSRPSASRRRGRSASRSAPGACRRGLTSPP